ncbi:MAG: hypothetical protein KatS3mg028_1342 [Bacteroidia bacterium]|nr:MAG: hypothetical protein KatS3mg028_0876 [Bacteroidia bacterium]GIV29829.1 MAG: hypothetical protein KatS3mg028_0895 [Bacteroidia bacterium]GIV30276.1 MAG: hypothetical protein KatS3mg028_1342 [Bacteroidia bacterium]
MKTKIFSLIIFTTLSINSFAQHGVTPPWQANAVQLPKVNPTYAAYTTVGRTMVVDKLGKIYVFYREFDINNMATERLYINTSSDGINWTPTIFPPAQNFKPGYYNVAIDTASNIHVVWVKNMTGELWYSKYDFNLQQWTIDTIISQSVNEVIRGTSVSVDRKMRVHVSWIDGQDASANAEIMYRRSPDNGVTWDNQQNISNTLGYPSEWQQGDFSGTFSDTLAYAWRENVNPSGSNWDIWIAYTTNGGTSWQSRSVNTASGVGQQRDPVLAVLKNNAVIIAYEDWPQGGGYKKIYAGITNNIVTTDPVFTQISDTVQSELLIEGYDYNNNLFYAFWKWRYATEAPNHMDIAGRYFDNSTSSWSNNTANNGVEWCTDIGTAELGFKKCAIGQDGTVHLLYGTPPTGVASLYYTYRPSPSVGISTFNYPAINITVYPNPFSTQTTLQTNKNLKDATLTVYNVYGQQVKQIKNISGQTITLFRDNLPSGLYFVRLTQDNKIITADKLVITD